MSTYSFADISASLVGPGGAISLGYGSGVADEGIAIAAKAEKSAMTVGADGEVMHTLRADKSGTVTLTYLKTSPVNARCRPCTTPSRWTAACGART